MIMEDNDDQNTATESGSETERSMGPQAYSLVTTLRG
jgi:hypothetical protein